jgi:hypothetical protein
MQCSFFILSNQRESVIPKLHTNKETKWILGNDSPVTHWQDILCDGNQSNVLGKESGVEWGGFRGGINSHIILQVAIVSILSLTKASGVKKCYYSNRTGTFLA